jgi:hypothetical protein
MKPLSLLEKIELAKWLLAEDALTGDQFKVAYVLLFQFHNSQNGALYPSYAQQATAAGVSEATAKRSVKILEELGILIVKRTDGGRNRPNSYTLKMVSPADPLEGENGITSGPLRVSPADPPGITSGPLRVSPADPHITMNINNEENKECIKEGGPPPVRQPSSKRPPASRGTRLSELWQLSENDVAYARELRMPAEMIEREAVKFKNHWLAAAGTKGIKRDWPRTWQTWCIRSIEFMANNQKARGNATSAMVEALQRRGSA